MCNTVLFVKTGKDLICIYVYVHFLKVQDTIARTWKRSCRAKINVKVFQNKPRSTEGSTLTINMMHLALPDLLVAVFFREAIGSAGNNIKRSEK